MLIENPVFFDVDDTICLWYNNKKNPTKDLLCPYYGTLESFVPHEAHIQAIKDHKAKGDTVIVWSQGGSEWAKAAVDALELHDYVDIIMSKPGKYYDDLDSVHWMANRTWIGKEPRLGSNPAQASQRGADNEE